MKIEIRFYRMPERNDPSRRGVDTGHDSITGRATYPGGAGTNAGETTAVTEDRDFEAFVGHHVVDRNEEVIGKLSSLWTDETNQVAYLGVKTSWFSGKHHIIPAHAARIDTRRERIYVPFTEEQVKDAPTFDPDAVLSDADEQRIEEYYSRFGHERRMGETTAATQTGTTTATQERRSGMQREGTTMQLSEEELKVGKRQVEAGGVRLRKIVRSEIVNQPVTLQREEVVVERVPATEARTAKEPSFKQEDVYIPLRREEPVIQKEAHVREEVRVRKDARSEQQSVSGQVRREDVEIERQGEAQSVGRSKT